MELHSRAFLPMHLFLYLMTRAVPRIMYNPKITSADKHTKKKKWVHTARFLRNLSCLCSFFAWSATSRQSCCSLTSSHSHLKKSKIQKNFGHLYSQWWVTFPQLWLTGRPGSLQSHASLSSLVISLCPYCTRNRTFTNVSLLLTYTKWQKL